MQILSIKRSLFIILCTLGTAVFAQDKGKPLGNETVIVVKPYTPSVNDAFKIKETPVINDSVSLKKKPVKYSIFSVPVASTFTPSKGMATEVEKEKRVRLFNNYVTLGFGTYSHALAEFYSNFEVNRSDNVGVYLTHNSSQGGIKNVVLDDKYYNTALNLNYNSRNRHSSWNTEIGLLHQLYNWYGLPNSEINTNPNYYLITPKHSFYGAGLGGELELYDSFFKKGAAKYEYFADSYRSGEHHFNANANFEVKIAEELIDTKLTADVLNGKFDRGYSTPEALKYNQLIFGITPSLLVLRDDLTLNLGVNFSYFLDTENSNNNFYLYPEITASYRVAGDYFIAFAGLEGGLHRNTYYRFAQGNPYVSPTLNVRPTDKPYDAYLGAKGKLSNSIGYRIQGGYTSEFDKPLYLHNSITANNPEDYNHGNSFGIVYDDVKTLSATGEINVDVNRSFKLGVSGTFFNYSTNKQQEAWNLPNYKASLNADYQITEKWYAGANLFFVGQRKDFQGMTNLAGNVVTLNAYSDLNANVGYRFNNQLSIFAKGNNLLGNNYQKWLDFPVEGIQVLAGATYKFDF